MRVIPCASIAICLLTLTTVRAETSSFTGRFQGTGRACYGTFAVEAKTISWLTPFSQCKSMRYQIIERGADNEQMKTVYRLNPGAASCRYTILTLTHSGTSERAGWEVTGYGSEQSYRTDKSSGYKTRSEDMMSCPLVREHGK
jgi:hypothetical protein